MCVSLVNIVSESELSMLIIEESWTKITTFCWNRICRLPHNILVHCIMSIRFHSFWIAEGREREKERARTESPSNLCEWWIWREKTIEFRHRVKWNEFVSLIGHRYARNHFKPFISLFFTPVSTGKRAERIISSYFLIGATVIVASTATATEASEKSTSKRMKNK